MGRKPSNRKRKNDWEKKQEWVEQLYPYLQENGLKGITMDRVAQELNKSKTTVYEYFRTKEELVELVLEFKLAKIAGFEKIIEDDSQSFKERCYSVLKHQADHISDISNVFLADLRSIYPRLWQKVESFLDKVAEKTSLFYQKGIEKKEFNAIHPSILTVNDQLFFRTLTDPAFLASAGLSLKEAFDQYWQLKFFGLIRKKE